MNGLDPVGPPLTRLVPHPVDNLTCGPQGPSLIQGAPAPLTHSRWIHGLILTCGPQTPSLIHWARHPESCTAPREMVEPREKCSHTYTRSRVFLSLFSIDHTPVCVSTDSLPLVFGHTCVGYVKGLHRPTYRGTCADCLTDNRTISTPIPPILIMHTLQNDAHTDKSIMTCYVRLPIYSQTSVGVSVTELYMNFSR